ncbi:flagellar FliJ family protein [Magnetospira sp. QH-2]|uniref:flagellar FliJ family protein n=1 Tax=Magnetospira sp. (strain QH-2) TaxID=1288970 RepID=UPI0003E80DA7|nr:flagellar FliJ family protein [Magnetospira sp. QH-2]CCQ74053.1 Conserved protein of unknown function [Magnetospira sp. QH-2]
MAEKDLHTLIRLAQFTVDERRRALGERLNALYQLEEQSRRLEEQVVEEQEIAARLPQFALTYGAFADGVNAKRELLAKATADVEALVEQAQEHLGEAYIDLKAYEQSQKLRDARTKQEEDRREQAQLDEIGMRSHLLKVEENR